MTSPGRRNLELPGPGRAFRQRIECFGVDPASRSRSVSIQRSNSVRPGTLKPSRKGPPYRATALSSAPSAIGFLVRPDVDSDDVRVEPQRRTGRGEHVGGQRAPERENELLEIVARTLGIELWPEQRERTFPWQTVVAC